MSVRLRVGYLNVQGLTQDKADVLGALVGPDKDYDILFLAETWHISLRPNPLTLISSPPPPPLTWLVSNMVVSPC